MLPCPAPPAGITGGKQLLEVSTLPPHSLGLNGPGLITAIGSSVSLSINYNTNMSPTELSRHTVFP